MDIDTAIDYPDMNTEIIDSQTTNDFEDAETYSEDIKSETFDNNEEMQSKNIEVDAGSLDDADNHDADFFEAMSKEFGQNAAKHIVLKTCKTAGIALFESKRRNFQPVLSVNNIEELKSSIQSFTKASVDLNIQWKVA
ncbi:unnamed protein product [Mucor circinelloides]